MPRNHLTGILFGAAALWASFLIFAPIALALPEDADQPIHIRADNAEIDQRQGLAIYRGETNAAPKLSEYMGKMVNAQGPIYRQHGVNLIEIQIVAEQ